MITAHVYMPDPVTRRVASRVALPLLASVCVHVVVMARLVARMNTRIYYSRNFGGMVG